MTPITIRKFIEHWKMSNLQTEIVGNWCWVHCNFSFQKSVWSWCVLPFFTLCYEISNLWVFSLSCHITAMCSASFLCRCIRERRSKRNTLINNKCLLSSCSSADFQLCSVSFSYKVELVWFHKVPNLHISGQPFVPYVQPKKQFFRFRWNMKWIKRLCCCLCSAVHNNHFLTLEM